MGCDFGGLTLMTQNRFSEGQRFAVMHEPRPGAHAPERRSPQFGARGLTTVLDYPVARADVMQQEVAEWSNNLEAKIIRHVELSAVDGCRWPRRENGRNMADTATVRHAGHVDENLPARLNVRYEARIVLDVLVLRRSFRRSHKLGEGIDIALLILCARATRTVWQRFITGRVVGYRVKVRTETHKAPQAGVLVDD